MDRRKLRKLDYIAGVTPEDNLQSRDLKRSRLPSMYCLFDDHKLRVDISAFESLDQQQLENFIELVNTHPVVIKESTKVEDCVIKASLSPTLEQYSKDNKNWLMGHVSSAAELALRNIIELEQ